MDGWHAGGLQRARTVFLLNDAGTHKKSLSAFVELNNTISFHLTEAGDNFVVTN